MHPLNCQEVYQILKQAVSDVVLGLSVCPWIMGYRDFYYAKTLHPAEGWVEAMQTLKQFYLLRHLSFHDPQRRTGVRCVIAYKLPPDKVASQEKVFLIRSSCLSTRWP